IPLRMAGRSIVSTFSCAAGLSLSTKPRLQSELFGKITVRRLGAAANAFAGICIHGGPMGRHLLAGTRYAPTSARGTKASSSGASYARFGRLACTSRRIRSLFTQTATAQLGDSAKLQ